MYNVAIIAEKRLDESIRSYHNLQGSYSTFNLFIELFCTVKLTFEGWEDPQLKVAAEKPE